MNYLECPPEPELADYVLDFWQISTTDPADVVPSQLYATDMMRIRFMIFNDRLQALVYGPSTSPHRKGLYLGDQVSFGATMLPTAARYLFGYDVSHFRDLRVDLGVLWPDEIEELCDRIWRADFSERVDVLSTFLRRRLVNADTPHPDFMNAYLQLNLRHGEATISELCRHVGVSHRTLNRQFHSHVGLSPKECARILRLHNRLNAAKDGARADAVEGFADQSHWIREFKAMIGVSPHRYFTELHALHQMDHDYWEGTAVSYYMSPPPPVVRFPGWHARKNGAFSPHA